jgi:outer membrane cobalamin receptor
MTSMSKVRKLVFFLAVFAAGLSPEVLGQEHPTVDSRNVPVPDALLDTISVHFDTVPIREALHIIAGKGNFKLNYNEDIFRQDMTVTYSAGRRAAFLVLQSVLRGTGINIIVLTKRQVILVKRKDRSEGDMNIRHTISGYVTDAETGEVLVGASVFVSNLGTGTSSNAYGFYSITLPASTYLVQFSYLGYSPKDVLMELESDLKQDVQLLGSSIEADTILVLSQTGEVTPSEPRLGIIQLVPEQLKTIPVLLGEQDLLKVIQLLPGVSNPREGDCGLYVRGGDADQNLILLDEATVYSPFHTFGFLSIFNSDAIRNIKFMKGTAPAKYGGRLSSVIDMQMKEGNMKEFEGTAGIGIIFSRLMLQGPIQKDKASFLISGRRTYFDIFTKLSNDARDLEFHFYDLNAKLNYKIDDDDRIYASGYWGRDGIGFADAFSMDWGNTTGTIRWNHLFSNKLFLNSSLILSKFKYELDASGEDPDDDRVQWVSEVGDITIKEDFEYFHDAGNTLGFGIDYVHHSFLPAEFLITDDKNYTFVIGKKSADQLNAYVSHEHAWNDKLRLEYGIRASLFSVTGEADKFDIEDADALNVEFHGNEEKTYYNLQPRISAVYLLDGFTSIKAGYAKNYQYLHMISSSNSGTPLDVWQPSSMNIKPQISDQLSVGYFKNAKDNAYEFSVEMYYKDLKNQVDYKDGANFFFKNYFDSELVFGDGRAYGLELLWKKNSGNLTGWIAYSVSTSRRQFDQINSGNSFPARSDRTHELNVVAQYRLNRNWLFSANFVFASGFTITLPYGKYTVFNEEVLAYTARNAYRLPPHHRLDIGISYITDGGGVWNFSLYNAYGRRNVYTVLFRDRADQPGLKEAVKLSLFSMVPSLSYTFTF